MSTSPDPVHTCELCGATIYPEHIRDHAAERWKGQLLCPHCLREAKGTDAPLRVPELLASDGPGAASAVSTARPSTATSGMTAPTERSNLKRKLQPDSPQATRCRTFHAKLTDAAFVHMNEQINDWVDAHEDIRIKFATSSVGVVEGKHPDPHLIVVVFY